MLNQQNTASAQPTASYSFTGAELAAIRLVELLSNHPKAKALLESMTKNQESNKEMVEKLAAFIDEPAKKADFVKIMTEHKPVEELKNSLVKFISNNFEHRQIEYAISLMSDLRLGDLLKQGASVAERVGNKFLAEPEKFSHTLEEILQPKK